jgi:hypothetical protein
MIPRMAKPRRHKRRSLWGVADVWNNNSNHKTTPNEPSMVFCLVRNISVSGIGMFSVTPLSVGSAVTIKRLKLFENLVDNCIQGTVVWVNSRGNSYDMGISFNEDIDRETYPEIYAALTRDRYDKVSISGIPTH